MKKYEDTFTYRLIPETLAFMALGLIPRLILLFHSQAGIESDEAIVGLMGKHILEGKDIPVFYYGQSYMGSLEAMFAAVSFFFFGVNNFALKLVPLVFSIIFIGIVYVCGFLYAGRTGARIAALYVAIPPSPLVIWSLKARGGFIETLVIGSLAILFTLVLLQRRKYEYRKDLTLWTLISLILGLGWWTNNQIIFYIAPLGIVLLPGLFSYKGGFTRLKITIFSLITFIIGGFPFWFHNIFIKPRWSSFQVLFGSTAGGNAGEYFADYWSTALPIILGARQFWSDFDTFEGASSTVYLLYILPVILSIFISFTTYPQKQYRHNSSGIFFIILFLIFVPAIFSLSSFGWLSQAPRYLLPLYSVLPLLLGITFSRLLSYDKALVRIAGVLLFSGLLGVNLSSNYLHGIADEGQPFIYKHARVAKDHTDLYEWLEKEGHTHIYTNYWVGYRVAFETCEQVTFSLFGHPYSIRIPEYESKTQLDKIVDKVFVLAHNEFFHFKKWLKSIGVNFRVNRLDSYTVVDQIAYATPEGKRVPLTTDQITFFIPPWGEDPPETAKNISALIDGNPETRWGTGKPQAPGMAIEIALDTPQYITRIVLDHTGFPHDTPNSLKISGYHAETDELITLYDMNDVPFFKEIRKFNYAAIPALWDIRFEAVPLGRVRFELMGSIPVFDWSMNDLQLYSREEQ